MKHEFAITGRISRPDGRPCVGATVRAFDKHLPSLRARGLDEERLGVDAWTDADGCYEIEYTDAHFVRGDAGTRAKPRPDLAVRAFHGDLLLGESAVLFNAPETAVIDLTVVVPERSEFELLVSYITPVLQGIALADLSDDDLAFLAGETGIGHRPPGPLHHAIERVREALLPSARVHGPQPDFLGTLRASARLGRETGLPDAAFYGLAREGHAPALDQLLATPGQVLRSALIGALDRRVIPEALRSQVDAIVHDLKRFGFVRYAATGRLVDEFSGAPLGRAGLKVRISAIDEIDAGDPALDLGTWDVNAEGRFAFDYAGPPPPGANPTPPVAAMQFSFAIIESGGQVAAEVKISIVPGQSDTFDVPVPSSLADQPVTAFADRPVTESIALPSELARFLEGRGIRTLADVSRSGGLSTLSGLPVPADDAALATLEAHADLSRVSSDLAVHRVLIAKGYTRVSDIADVTSTTFASAMRGLLGDFGAARVHLEARVQTALLDNAAAGILVAGQRADLAGLSAASLAPARCACDDCEAATSPAAYLVDLLAYVIKHVLNDARPLTLPFLEATFHQPFDALPTDCDAVNERVRQVRICVEVLRGFVATVTLPPDAQAALDAAERAYRLNTYLALLTSNGTSYAEIRAARTAPDDQRSAIADRLGIRLSTPRLPGGDELDRLFLDGTAPPGDPSSLTERAIEMLFGLADTTRDPLSAGARLGDNDASPAVTRWRLSGVQWGRNTDANGYVYLSEERPNPVVFVITAYRDALRQQQVAASDQRRAFGALPLLAKNDSDLGGMLEVAAAVPPSAIALSVVPELLSWRLKRLREIWVSQDRPPDAYADDASPVLPVVDPDIVGPDDFRTPFPKASPADPTRAYDLWLARRGWIDKTFAQLAQDRIANGLAFVLQEVLGTPGPMPDLDALLQKVTGTVASDVVAAIAAITALQLQVDEFLALMVIRAKDLAAADDPRNPPVDDSEWRDVESILTQCIKRRRFLSWRTEESSAGVRLGPEEFWTAIAEPAESDWPPLQAPDVPLIDPDSQTVKALPEYVAGVHAREAWTQRRDDLVAIAAALKSTRESGGAFGFESMLRLAIGFPNPGDPLQHDPDALRSDLLSNDPTRVASATAAVTKDFCLSVDAFGRLMTVRDQDRQPDPAKKPLAADYAAIYALLTTARKVKHEYPQWTADEVARFGAEAAPLGEPVAYWKARKAALPRWRASADARQRWTQALLAREQPPAIDPDLLTEDDLRDPFPSRPPFPLHPAFDLLQVRRKWVDDIEQAIVGAARTVAAFDAALQLHVGISPADLLALDAARQAGIDIQARLDQLDLSNRGFAFLVSIRGLLAQSPPQPILDAEWRQVASIMTQARKVRFFAAWRAEEAAAAITVSPDSFVLVSSAAFSDPSALDPWRAPWKSRVAWQDTLRSRIDQENDVAAEIRDANGAVEGALLPALRDALVDAAGPVGATRDDRATWLEKRLLVAMDDDGCAETTRIEQALETLQGLVLGLTTGSFQNGLEFSDLSAVSAAPGLVDLFATGVDGALWHRWNDGTAWHPWESLGGDLQFGPGAVSRGVGRLDVFGCARDNQLVWKTFVGGAWTDWVPLGGFITASPSAVSVSAGRIDIFVRGSDGALYSYAIQDSTVLGWQLALGAPPPGYFFSAPAATWPGADTLTFIYVFVWGADNALYKLDLVNGATQGWDPSLQGILNAHPTAVSPSPGRLDIFVRAADNAIYQFAYQGPFPLGWQADLGGLVASAPAAASTAPGEISVFVRGANGALYQKRFMQSAWGPWELLDPFALTFVDAEQFDEEWKWMGSYATWRSAMLVFLYPENLCAPSLRSRYTPAFADSLGSIRASRNMTESLACEIARQYAAAYEDIAKIEIAASCEAQANVVAGTPCAPITMPPKPLVFLFGRGGITGRAYWSTFDFHDTSDFAQSFWNVVPGIDDVAEIVAAMPYQKSASERWIFLFIRDSSASLRFVTFDLQALSWSSPKDLALPPGIAAAIKVVPALYRGALSPPTLAIWTPPDNAYYLRPLGSDGGGWADGDWSRFAVDLRAQQQWSPVSDLFAADDGLLYVRDDSGRIMPVSDGQARSGSPSNPDDELLGFINYSGLGHPYTFLRGTDGAISLKDLEMGVGPSPIGFLLTGLNRVARQADTGLGTFKVFMAYERKYPANPVAFELQGTYAWHIDSADPDGQARRTLLAPRALTFVDGQFSIPSHVDEVNVLLRRFNLWLVNLFGGESGMHRTYSDEAYYFVPIALAQALQASGEFDAALRWFRTVYDYAAPIDERKIYYGLILEESLPDQLGRGQDWLLDPLDPHAIAATRRNTYTKFTIQAIVRCLLDYADAEFTRDTSESNARARSLYRTALELLDAPELTADDDACKTLAERIGPPPGAVPGFAAVALARIKRRLAEIGDRAVLTRTVAALEATLASSAAWPERIEESRTLAAAAERESVALRSIGGELAGGNAIRKRALAKLLSAPGRAVVLREASARASARFRRDVAGALAIPASTLDEQTVALPWLTPQDPMARERATGITSAVAPLPRAASATVPAFLRAPRSLLPTTSFTFCVPANPVIDGLRSHATTNLRKLGSCRNIAGLVRVVDPYAVPTDSVSGLPTVSASGQIALAGTITITPTQYRYAVLIERAKQLAQFAAQFETSMLSALEKQDAEAYTLLKARQDVKLADAGVQLQSLRQKQANDGVTLAQLQQARAQLQVQHFQDLLDKGESQLEKDAITYLGVAADNLADASTFSYAGVVASGATAVASAAEGSVTGVISGASGVLSGLGPGSAEVAAKYSTRASILATMASYERRKQDWDFSRSLAEEDVAIGGQQITIANDEVSIADQEKAIADIQAGNAKDTVAFLNNKFTNVDLYEWMSGILQNVYGFFLKQASATAKIAENQLAFERQEPPPGFIQADYWNATSDLSATTTSGAPDRRGLTGSARLLQDIFKLDDYAFSTNQRKLQLTKVVSLARLAPIEFQQFRETGLLRFATPMQLFDREFPGHYLRLITRVRTSVIALIPPNAGIHAMLFNTGLSRVVIGGDTFQTSSIRRQPESVALSSPVNATGVAELTPANTDLLLPFEGCGVDGAWEFRLPKSSNLFDFSSISDVLLTVEYSALYSSDFQRQLQQTLDPTVSAEMPYGFRNQFADQWYDLHNPDQSPTPMTVQFRTVAEDFPPNLIDLRIQQVALYFSRANGQDFEVFVSSLRFREQGAAGYVGGASTTVDGLISTRRGNGSSWNAMKGRKPFGDWTLELEDTEVMRDRFANDDIQDILFVVTYSGLTSP